MVARGLGVVLGLWTFVSAFAWHHSRFQFHNAWITGALAVTLGLTALRGANWARYTHAALGAWLIVSTFLMTVERPATAYNHIVVGTTFFVMALFPPRETTRGAARDARTRRRLW